MKPMQLESAMIRRLVIMIYDRLTCPATRQELADQLSPLLDLRADQIERSSEAFAEIACFKLVLECLVLQSTIPEEQFCDPDWGHDLSHRCYAAFAEYYARRSQQNGQIPGEGTAERLYDHICTYEKAVKSQGLAMAGTIFTQQILNLFGRGRKSYSGSQSTIITLLISSSILTNYWPEQFEEFEIAPDVDATTPVSVMDRRGTQRSRIEHARPAARRPLFGGPPSHGTAGGGKTMLGYLQMGMERFFDAISHLTEPKRNHVNDGLDPDDIQPWDVSCNALVNDRIPEPETEFESGAVEFEKSVTFN